MRPVLMSRITQPFADPGGYASASDRHGPAGHHTGVDYGLGFGRRQGKDRQPRWSLEGMRVRATHRGRVVVSDYNSTMGHWVCVRSIEDGRPVVHSYWHLKVRKVRVGQRVRRGQTIGRVGNTGNSTGPHLHYQENWGRGFDYGDHRRPRFNRIVRRKRRRR